jgi:hypothetical protein
VATGKIAWTGGSTTEVFGVFFMYTPDAGTSWEGWVRTSGSSIDLARLTKLGLPLSGGPTTITLRGDGRASSLDAMVDEQTLASPDETQLNLVNESFTLTP